MEVLVSVLLVVVAFHVLVLALSLVLLFGLAAVVGALVLCYFASEQGFIGLAAYVACWVFLFPVMLVISIIIGFVMLWTDMRKAKQLLGYGK